MQGTNEGHKVIRQERKLTLFFSELSILGLETTALLNAAPLPRWPRRGSRNACQLNGCRNTGADIFGLSDAYRVDSNQFACVVFPGLRWQKFSS